MMILRSATAMAATQPDSAPAMASSLTSTRYRNCSPYRPNLRWRRHRRRNPHETPPCSGSPPSSSTHRRRGHRHLGERGCCRQAPPSLSRPWIRISSSMAATPISSWSCLAPAMTQNRWYRQRRRRFPSFLWRWHPYLCQRSHHRLRRLCWLPLPPPQTQQQQQRQVENRAHNDCDISMAVVWWFRVRVHKYNNYEKRRKREQSWLLFP